MKEKEKSGIFEWKVSGEAGLLMVETEENPLVGGQIQTANSRFGGLSV